MLITVSAGQQRVAHGCPLSARAGVVPGMSLAHARALLSNPNLHTEPFDPARDHHALIRLAQWATRDFSPRVAIDPPDGLLLDITGCARLFHGEHRLLHRLLLSLQRLGFTARLAAAPTFAAAWALARFVPVSPAVLDDANPWPALDRLPLRALAITAEHEAALRQVGVERIGQLRAIPRAQLAQRFGDAILHRLDQIAGLALESIDPVQPFVPPSVQRVCDGPCLQLEAIQIAVRQLVESLCHELTQRHAGARTLLLDLERVGLPAAPIALSLSQPSRDARHITALLLPRLEHLSMGWGVERLTLTAPRIGRIRHAQRHAWFAASDESAADRRRAWSELLDQLVNRLGAARVTTLQPAASHLPERQFVHVPAAEEAMSPRTSNTDAHASPHAPHPLDQPAVLFDRPRPIEAVALTPDGPVARIRWRDRDHAVITSLGPWRIALEWWRPEASPGSVVRARDYFRIQTEDGQWLWIFRQLDNARWFVHGQWC